MSTVLFALLTSAAVCALGVMCFGHRLLNMLRPIRQLHLMKSQWEHLYVRTDHITISQLCQRRFEEVSSIITECPVVRDIADKRVGDLVSVVYYRPRYLRKVVQEIRGYATGFLILFVIGIAMAADGVLTANTPMSPALVVALGHEMFSNHLIPIPVVQAILMGLSGLRLWMEVKNITSLLELD